MKERPKFYLNILEPNGKWLKWPNAFRSKEAAIADGNLLKDRGRCYRFIVTRQA